MFRRAAWPLLLCAAVTAGQEPPAPPRAAEDPALAPLAADALRAHVEALAADAMRGRDARHGGIELAAAYVAEAMGEAGLVPLEGQEGFRLPFRLARLRQDPAATGLHRDECHLAIGDGWVAAGILDGTFAGPAVWAGRSAEGDPPALGPWARGAVVFAGAPGVFDRRATPAALERLGAAARAAGAVGAFLVAGEDLDRDWGRVAAWAVRERPGTPEEIVRPPGIAVGWVERRCFGLLVGLPAAVAALGGPDTAPTLAPGAPLAPEIALRAGATADEIRTYANVAGRVPGCDPARRDEVVLLSAHYDHIGLRDGVPEGQDGIFNGADDDASGVAAILALGAASAAAPPARTVCVVAFTGEEEGLLGSRAFAERPPLPLDRIVAGVNVEMIGRPAATGPGTAWVTGYAYSTLGEILRAAAEPSGLRIAADPYPQMGFFFRSDNASLARAGIPAHTVSTYDPKAHRDYHGVDDEADRCDFPNMAAVVRGIFQGVRTLAAGTATPAWDANAPFRRR